MTVELKEHIQVLGFWFFTVVNIFKKFKLVSKWISCIFFPSFMKVKLSDKLELPQRVPMNIFRKQNLKTFLQEVLSYSGMFIRVQTVDSTYIGNSFGGPERWLSGKECLLILQGTHVQFPAPVSGGSQPPITPGTEEPMCSALSGHLHTCNFTHRGTDTFFKKIWRKQLTLLSLKN